MDTLTAKLSLSSDEGLGISDPEYTTISPTPPPPPVSPSSPLLTISPPLLRDTSERGRKSVARDEAPERAVLYKRSISEMTPHEYFTASIRTSLTAEPPAGESTGKKMMKRRKSSDLVIDEPVRRRSRRRASKVLSIALAVPEKGMKIASLLERYQVLSLACSVALTSVKELRDIITSSPRNSEAQNYKLSYEREPH